MNADVFAKWLRRQGHHVYRSESSYWYNAGPRVLQAFPYHWLIKPSKKELRGLTMGKNNVALRYSLPMDANEGMVSYHVILNNPYDLEILRPQARNGIRRGLEHFRVEKIPWERMATEGWALQRDTLERQCRVDSMKQNEWERLCLAAKDLPGFDVWASISLEGVLAATILTARIDDTCYVPYAQCHRDYMCLHANNALFYNASRAMLAYEGVNQIFFSLHSLDAPESVNDFKFRMGLIAKPVRQKIVFHPLLEPLANDFIYRKIKGRMEKDPSNSFLAKAEGILRFHLQGKQPLEKQDTPLCLKEYKAKLLGLPLSEVAGKDSYIRILAEI